MAHYDKLSLLQVQVDAGVAYVTIHNPPLNVLDANLMTELHQFAVAVEADDKVRVVILQSADPEIWVAHGDMNFVTNPSPFLQLEKLEAGASPLNPMQRLHERFRTLPQVTIAKIAGFARCGGNELAMSLDMRFAAMGKTGLAQSEVLMGIIPGGGGTQHLTRLLGAPRALEVILGAELFTAETAERYGWINRALPKEELDSFVNGLARNIAALPIEIITAAKAAVGGAAGPLGAGLAQENALMGVLFARPYASERIQAQLNAGAQTRAGEREFERVLRSN